MSCEEEHLADIPTQVSAVAQCAGTACGEATQCGFVERVVDIPRKIGVGGAVLVVDSFVGVHLYIMRVELSMEKE